MLTHSRSDGEFANSYLQSGIVVGGQSSRMRKCCKWLSSFNIEIRMTWSLFLEKVPVLMSVLVLFITI